MSQDAEELVFGRLPLLEALRSGEEVRAIWLAEGARVEGPLAEALKLARRQGVAVRRVPRDEVERRAAAAGGDGPVHTQGVVAALGPFAYSDLDSMLAAALRRGEAPLLLALDEVQDVHNLAGLLRSAEAAGAHGALLPPRRAAGVTAAVRRVSAGAVAWLPVAQVELAPALDRLAERGLAVVGLDAEGELAHSAADLSGPLVVVVGGESRGLSKPVRRRCALTVRLPMRGHVASLNAAVAGSIVLYEALRQRELR
jgi:23S rRNA (guanosine2251-2'-O)-methyltransferase